MRSRIAAFALLGALATAAAATASDSKLVLQRITPYKMHVGEISPVGVWPHFHLTDASGNPTIVVPKATVTLVLPSALRFMKDDTRAGTRDVRVTAHRVRNRFTWTAKPYHGNVTFELTVRAARVPKKKPCLSVTVAGGGVTATAKQCFRVVR